jgi:hypothetical protein
MESTDKLNNNPQSMKKKNKKARKVQKKVQLVEIARSFSFKLNVGNYESRDFFCSQKAECPAKDAEKVSEALYRFCKQEVLKSVNQFKAIDKKKVGDVAKDESENDL